MKAILFIGAILIILAASFSRGVSTALKTNPSALPAVQRTAVYAPAVATQSAGASLTDNANAQAAAQEQEAARVYAQAVQEEQAKRVIVATQQAVFATQTANDAAVSREYATLTAISLQATSEAISRTMNYDAEQYRAGIAMIKATSEAIQAQAFEVAVETGKTDSIGYFWTWLPTAAALIMFALFVLVLWKLIGKITPRIEIEEVEVHVPFVPPVDLQQPVDEAKRAKKLADHQLAAQYIEDSIRHNGAKSTKLLTAPEWEALGYNRDCHTLAVAYLRDDMKAIYTQQGGKSDEQGTRVKEAGKDLVYLFHLLSTTPLP